MNDNVRAGVLRPANIRKRRMLLVFPILIIPFLTLAFWALSGGKGNEAKAVANSAGLNLVLPDPKMKNETLDKLGFYDKADKDSLKRIGEMRNDPFYSDHSSIEKGNELEQVFQQTSAKYHQSSPDDEIQNSNPHAAEEKLMQKLAELNQVISQPTTRVRPKLQKETGEDNLEQFQRGMEALNIQPEKDTELQQLNSMMDKIIKIQHPEEKRQKSLPEKTCFYTVTGTAMGDTISNGFYSLSNESLSEVSNSIQAVVHQDQTLVNGAVVKLRLTTDMYVKEEKIPSGTFVFGTASLNGERLEIEINSIRSGNSIYPVKLQIFDLDGLAGIYVPGAVTRDVAKQSADNSLQNMQLTTLDPSLAAQATAAGITTVKNLLSKKVKMIKVSVKKGYKVLVKNQTI
jgi:hypothetical protein